MQNKHSTSTEKGFKAIKKAPLYGLVLSGGKSYRMGEDKGELHYHGQVQRLHVKTLLEGYCRKVFISANDHSLKNRYGEALTPDVIADIGPMAGLLAAFARFPRVAWLAVACDLPYLNVGTLDHLLNHRKPDKVATAYADPKNGMPESMVVVWEPNSYAIMLNHLKLGQKSLCTLLRQEDTVLVPIIDNKPFFNVNYPQERMEVLYALRKPYTGEHE